MRLFKILWESKTKAGTWIAFEAHKLGHPFMFTYSRNPQYTQWFCNINIFPIAIQKNNAQFSIGLSLVKYFIGFNFHLNFGCKERKKEIRPIDIVFIPEFKNRKIQVHP